MPDAAEERVHARRDLLAIAQLRCQRAAIHLQRATAAGREIERDIEASRCLIAELGCRKRRAEHDGEKRLLLGESASGALEAFVALAERRQQNERHAVAQAQKRLRENQEEVRRMARSLLAQEERVSLHRRALQEHLEAELDTRDEDNG
jgi:TolA-binding protein